MQHDEQLPLNLHTVLSDAQNHEIEQIDTSEWTPFSSRLTPEARAALAFIGEQRHQKKQTIISTLLIACANTMDANWREEVAEEACYAPQVQIKDGLSGQDLAKAIKEAEGLFTRVLGPRPYRRQHGNQHL